MPHVYCLRDPGLVKLHFLSDGLIAISYFVIPLALLLLIRQRRDLVFPWIFALFGVFILGCGITHVLGIVTLWYPVYRLDGLVKAITAAASIGTAGVLFRRLPKLISLPSPQQHLAAIVESSDDAIFSYDLDGLITSWNKGAEETFGYTSPDVLGKHIAMLLPDDRRGEAANILDRIERGEKVSHFETVRRTKEGREIAVSLAVSPMLSASGRIIGISKIARDITKRKQAEQALERANMELRNSEERFRTLADFVPDMLWTTDHRGVATYVSRRYQAYTGLPLEDLLGEGWTRFLHPDDRQRIAQVWSESVATGQPYATEYRLRRSDGTYRWFVARGIPIVDPGGLITQWLGSSTDIDELKRTEQALRRSNEELEQFAYAAAHDMQEPLRNVSTSLGMLQRLYGDRLEDGAAEWIQGGIAGALRMHAMVKDLLLYSRAVSDCQGPPSEVDAAAAAERALQNLNGPIAESEALVHSENLPRVAVLESHLVQVFQNLISNAVKYRRRDTRLRVQVSAEPKGHEWEFAVEDNGIGFDPAYADRIFNVFKRLHRHDEYPGNGIGLAICARIIAHYGGRIWAEGRPGQGATVKFTLPAYRT